MDVCTVLKSHKLVRFPYIGCWIFFQFAVSAGAQEIATLKAMPAEVLTGQTVTIEITFKRRANEGACALTLNWGDGNMPHMRMDSDKPNTATHEYAKEGAYAIIAEPKTMFRGFKGTSACEGGSKTAVVTVRDAAKVRAEQQAAADKRAAVEEELAMRKTAEVELARARAEAAERRAPPSADNGTSRVVQTETENINMRDTVDPEFIRGLGSQNAGQLFATADEMKGAGRLLQAREAYKALMTRFPNHALVATAAQQMAALPPPPKGYVTPVPGGTRSPAKVSSEAPQGGIPSIPTNTMVGGNAPPKRGMAVCEKYEKQFDDAGRSAMNSNFVKADVEQLPNAEFRTRLNELELLLMESCFAGNEKQIAGSGVGGAFAAALKSNPAMRASCLSAGGRCTKWPAKWHQYMRFLEREVIRARADPTYTISYSPAKWVAAK